MGRKGSMRRHLKKWYDDIRKLIEKMWMIDPKNRTIWRMRMSTCGYRTLIEEEEELFLDGIVGHPARLPNDGRAIRLFSLGPHTIAELSEKLVVLLYHLGVDLQI